MPEENTEKPLDDLSAHGASNVTFFEVNGQVIIPFAAHYRQVILVGVSTEDATPLPLEVDDGSASQSPETGSATPPGQGEAAPTRPSTIGAIVAGTALLVMAALGLSNYRASSDSAESAPSADTRGVAAAAAPRSVSRNAGPVETGKKIVLDQLYPDRKRFSINAQIPGAASIIVTALSRITYDQLDKKALITKGAENFTFAGGKGAREGSFSTPVDGFVVEAFDQAGNLISSNQVFVPDNVVVLNSNTVNL